MRTILLILVFALTGCNAFQNYDLHCDGDESNYEILNVINLQDCNDDGGEIYITQPIENEFRISGATYSTTSNTVVDVQKVTQGTNEYIEWNTSIEYLNLGADSVKYEMWHEWYSISLDSIMTSDTTTVFGHQAQFTPDGTSDVKCFFSGKIANGNTYKGLQQFTVVE